MRHLCRAIAAATVLSLAGAVPASAESSASCTLDFDVEFGAAGAIRQIAPGKVRCFGRIGTSRIDPAGAVAYLSGSAEPGVTGCVPDLTGGRFFVRGYHFIGFEPRPSKEFEGRWRADGLGPVEPASGTGSADGYAITFAGAAVFVPRSGRCAGPGLAPGTLSLSLVIDTGSERAKRPSSEYPDPDPGARREQAPAGTVSEPAAVPRRRPRCKRRGSAKSKSSSRHCRRATRPSRGR